MPSLLDLPNEIVIPIINLVHAADIESFSSCNRRTYWLSEGAMKKHKENKKQYGDLDFGLVYEKGHWHQTQDVCFFLRAILDNDSLAHYPNKIRIGEVNNRSPISDGIWRWKKGDEAMAILAKCRDRILAKIETCHYIERQMQQNWAKEIFHGNEATIVALVVLYLPNLRSITLSNSLGHLNRLLQIISSIASANLKHVQNFPSPLSKLSHLKLKLWDNRNGDYDASLTKWLPIVAGLPSLRRFSGEGFTRHCSRRSNPCSRLTLTDVDFRNSDIDVKSFKYLLPRIRALQKFNYSHVGLPDIRTSWEPQKIVQLLQNHASYSLETLDLTSLSGDVLSRVLTDATFVDCLSNFRVLKRVHLDHRMFIEKRPIPMFKAKRLDTLDLEIYISKYGNAEKKIHRLVDLLPASIEIVDLIYPLHGKAEAFEMMKGLLELKQSRLPRLRGLRLEVNDKLDDGMKDSFRKAGIDLVWWKVRTPSARNKHEWQGKRFRERVEGDTLMETLGVEGLDSMLAVLGVE